MKNGDFYKHWKKGNEYFFCGIALPLNEYRGKKDRLEELDDAQDAHTPENEEIQTIKLYMVDGIMLIDRETPHVIYQAEKDYETNKVWAREVDDFFGYKNDNGTLKKKFGLMEAK